MAARKELSGLDVRQLLTLDGQNVWYEGNFDPTDKLDASLVSAFALTLLDDTSAANARTTLGLTIGTNVQAYDATLAALAAYNSNGILTQTAADTFAARTITGTTNQITVTNGSGVSGNPTLSLPADVVIPTVLTVPNTGLHILDTNASHDLIVQAGSDLTADRILTITTGDAARTLNISAANVTVSSYGATLVDDADASTARTTLGLGSLATLSAVGTSQITDANVTNAKLANMANATIKGRATAGTGVPEDLTASQVKTILAIGISDVSGLQTALDAKLDSSSYTSADVLAKLLTVDGSASGLDAQYLAGLSASQFLRSDQNGTLTGNLTITGDLTVQGDTVTIDASTLNVEDPVLVVGSANTGTAPYLGLKAERGTTDAFWVFDEADDRWTAYTSTNDLTTPVLGNIEAATFYGALSGNATTASAWATGRTLTLSGDVTGVTAAFTGSGNITLTATVVDDSHNHVISNVDNLQTTLDAKLALAGGNMTGTLGVAGATADATNKLAVNSGAVLFNNEGASVQVKINKAAGTDSASFLFQTAFSGRAEFGTLANNDFTLKVSADGSAWNDAFAVDDATGVTDFKQQPTHLGNALLSTVSDLDAGLITSGTLDNARLPTSISVANLTLSANLNVLDTGFILSDQTDNTKKASFELSGITTGTTRTYTLPNVTGTLATIANLAQSFAGAITFANATLTGTAITTMTLGGATTASTLNIGTGATASAVAKTVNVGTAGASGSTTTVNIGSAVAGATSNVTLNGTTINLTGPTAAASTINIGSQVNASAVVETINFGTGGASGSVTNINVGSQTSGATGTLTVATPTVVFNSQVTSIAAAAATVSALNLGLGGATADATNRLSVNTPSVLLNRETDDINVTLNKAAAGDDARFTFQTGFSTRALFGLLADDNFSVQVSPDGTAFNTGLIVRAADGDVTNLAVRSDFLMRDNTDRTKVAQFVLSGITTATTRSYTLPNVSSTLAVLAATQTFTGTTTVSGTFTASGATASLGTSTAASTINVGSGATVAAAAKTVNIGTAGVSTSTTTVNIGSAVAGALGTTNLNSPTVVFGSTNTAITISGSTVLTGSATDARLLYLGLGGATADATNRLSINTSGVLFNNAGTSIDMTFNKNAAANDASMSFKTGFSTRALVGTLGSDDFFIKTSADGSAFNTAMQIDDATGNIALGGASPDGTNALIVSANYILLDRKSTSIDVTFNKNAAGNDATFTFKTNYSTRAILGTAGSDNFTLKVSADGSTYNNALVAEAATGHMTGRKGGVLTAVQEARLNATKSLPNSTAVTAIFQTTEDTLTLEANTTYEFEGEFMVSGSAGTVAHTVNFSPLGAGTATCTTSYLAQGTNAAAAASTGILQSWITATGSTAVTPSFTPTAARTATILVKGRIVVTTAGTIIPSLAYSAAPGGAGTIAVNSAFRIWPIGSNTVVKVGDNWA